MMNTTRRQALKMLGGFGAVLAGGVTVAAQGGRRYGRLTVDGWHAHQRATGEHLLVFVDGEDVTDDCYEADDVEGYALIFCRDADLHKQWERKGALHVRDGHVCRVEVRGRVEIRPRTA